MADSMRNYVCITSSGKVEKYASQSISQIIYEKEKYVDPFISIVSTGLHDGISGDEGFEELKWHD